MSIFILVWKAVTPRIYGRNSSTTYSKSGLANLLYAASFRIWGFLLRELNAPFGLEQILLTRYIPF